GHFEFPARSVLRYGFGQKLPKRGWSSHVTVNIDDFLIVIHRTSYCLIEFNFSNASNLFPSTGNSISSYPRKRVSRLVQCGQECKDWIPLRGNDGKRPRIKSDRTSGDPCSVSRPQSSSGAGT